MKEKISPTQKVLNVWAIILVLWSLYRGYFKTDLPVWFDEFVAKPIFFLMPIYWYVKHNETISFFKSVGFNKKLAIEDIVYGCVAFVFIGGFGLLGLLIKGGQFAVAPLSANLFSILIISLGTAFSEEIVSRGFLLSRFLALSHNKLSSVLLTSILFFILHIPVLFTNPSITGEIIPILIVSDFALSVTTSVIYIQRKSIIFPILIHACYLMGLQLFLG